MATFERADKSVDAIVREILEASYPELIEHAQKKKNPLKFDLLMVSADRDKNGDPVGPALKYHGRAAAATIRAVPKADRALGRGDVEIRIDADAWKESTEAQRRALIDHELCHLIVMKKEDIAMLDDYGRLRFRMRAHDFEFGWFKEIAERHGEASYEVRQAQGIMKQAGKALFNIQMELPGLTIIDGGAQDPDEQAERELAEGGGPGRPPEERERAAESTRKPRSSRKAAAKS